MNTVIPEFGLTKRISCDLTAGICAFGYGGESNYGRSIPLLGHHKFRGGLTRYIVKPTLAWNINSIHTIGIGVNLEIARFRIWGLDNLRIGSIHSNHVTSQGSDYRPGIGASIGWIAQLTPCLSIGASYDSKILTHRLHKYKGLFPQKGRVDFPQKLQAGLAYKLTSNLVFAFDVMEILWKEEPAFGNRGNGNPHPAGSNKGPGIGWKNQMVFKYGLAYNWDDNLAFRTGFAHGTKLFPARETLQNTSINLVSREYITFGVTWSDHCQEITAFYIHGLRRSIKGQESIPIFIGGGEADLASSENWLGISYGRWF